MHASDPAAPPPLAAPAPPAAAGPRWPKRTRAVLRSLARPGAGRDALAIAAAVLAAFFVIEGTELCTAFFEFVHDNPDLELDAAILAGILSTFGLLAFSVRRWLELRREVAAREAAESAARAVVDTAADAIVVVDGAGSVRSFNRAAEAIFGYAAGEVMGRDVAMLLGGDRLSAAGRVVEEGAGGAGREVEGRRKDGSAVPLDLAVGEWRDVNGRRFSTAIMRDVSGRKADEARRVLLAREVDHRAKNALAVVQSVLRLTPRGEPAAFAAAVEARVAALARVHSLLAEGGWSGAGLDAVAERELAPYARAGDAAGGAARRPALSLAGPPMPLAPAAVQPLAMVLHELATNAAKHGAWSAPGGSVELRWRAERGSGSGTLRLRWTERGGPPVAASPPARRGFGSRVVEGTVGGQLGGALERRWEPEGLVVDVTVPLARVMAPGAGDPCAGGAAEEVGWEWAAARDASLAPAADPRRVEAVL